MCGVDGIRMIGKEFPFMVDTDQSNIRGVHI
jgi:hypothetical protein